MIRRLALSFRKVEEHGLPPCDGQTVYLGVNTAGYWGCFNDLSGKHSPEGAMCLYRSPEDVAVVMSDLHSWAALPNDEAPPRAGQAAIEELAA